MKAQSKIAVAAGALLALVLLVWRAIDRVAPAADVVEAQSEAPASPPHRGAGDANVVAPDLDAQTREPEPVRVATSPDASAAPKDETIELSGTVFDSATNQPASLGLEVVLYDASWDEQRAQIDGIGHYHATALRPGHWRVRARADGFQNLRLELDLHSGERQQRRDLALRKSDVVKVKLVAPDGSVLATEKAFDFDRGLALRPDFVATTEEPGPWLVQEKSDVQLGIARFRSRASDAEKTQARAQLQSLGYAGAPRPAPVVLPAEYFGVLEFLEPLPAWVALVARGRVLQKQLLSAGAQEVVFTVDVRDFTAFAGTVKLCVLDSFGTAPPRGVQVLIDSLGQRRGRNSPRSDGTITIDRVPAGRSFLRITAAERELVIEHIVVERDRVNDLGTFRLRELADIAAVVVDEADRPTSATFNVFPLDRFDASRLTLAERTFTSGVGGELRIAGVGRGRYLIRTSGDRVVADPVEVDTSSGRADGVVIRVKRATRVALRFRANPPGQALIRIQSSSGLPVFEQTTCTTDPVLTRLAPGNYSVQVDAGETWLWTQGLRVETEPLDVPLGH